MALGGLDTEYGGQDPPVIESDGAGGAFLGWLGYGGVHVGHVNPDGTAGGGLIVSNFGFESSLAITSDGAEGAIVA